MRSNWNFVWTSALTLNPSRRALHKTRPKVLLAHSVQSVRYSDSAKQMQELRSTLTRWSSCKISLTRGYKVRFCHSTQTWKDKIFFLIFSRIFLSYPVGQNRSFSSGVRAGLSLKFVMRTTAYRSNPYAVRESYLVKGSYGENECECRSKKGKQ